MEVVAARAKLTVSLRVTGVRADGYHLIDAEMVTLDLADELVFDTGDGLAVIEAATGLAVPVDDDNLVRQALRAVDRTAHVTLTKCIPAGAGLGGGSADAAAVLRWAGCDDLGVAASRAGADVPFCVRGGRARVGGIGEQVDPLPFTARTYTLLTPPFGCSTPAVYRAWDDPGRPPGRRRPERPRAGGAAGRAAAGRVARSTRRRHGPHAGAGRQREHLVRRGLVPGRRSRGRQHGRGQRVARAGGHRVRGHGRSERVARAGGPAFAGTVAASG